MVEDAWKALADPFVDGAYATVKGQVRTYVLHQAAAAPARPRRPRCWTLEDAGHQSFPLARLGYDVTVLARRLVRRERVDKKPQRRPVTDPAGPSGRRVRGRGHRWPAVLGRALPRRPDVPSRTGAPARRLVPMRRTRRSGLDHGAQRRDDGRAAGARARWADALAGFDATGEIGVLGTPTRGDTVEHLSELLRRGGVEPRASVRSRCGPPGFSEEACCVMDLPVPANDATSWSTAPGGRELHSRSRAAFATLTGSSAACSTSSGPPPPRAELLQAASAAVGWPNVVRSLSESSAPDYRGSTAPASRSLPAYGVRRRGDGVGHPDEVMRGPRRCSGA